MKIEKATHKLTLFNLFYQPNPNAAIIPGVSPFIGKKFVLERLADAGSAKRKLISKYEEKEGKRFPVFQDGEVTFDPGEIVVLKDLFDAEKEWDSDLDLVVAELHNIFYPKKK